MPGLPVHVYPTKAALTADTFPSRSGAAYFLVAENGLIYKSDPGSTTTASDPTVLAPDDGSAGRYKTTLVEQPGGVSDVLASLAAATVDVTIIAGAAGKSVDLQVGATPASVIKAKDSTGTRQLGFYGVTPVARPAAYTQTYATATRTVAAPTAVAPAAYTQTYATATRTVPNATAAAVATTAATNTSPYGYAQAQADAIPVAINALEADVLELKKLINSLINDNATFTAAMVADHLIPLKLANSLIDDAQSLGLAQ